MSLLFLSHLSLLISIFRVAAAWYEKRDVMARDDGDR